MESEFLKTLVLVFGVSALTVFLLHIFKVHPLVGFIAAGILIRPEGLGIIKDPRDIEMLADIGVVLLLFIVGIEFSKSRLFRSYKAVMAGAGQVLITITVSTAVFYPFIGDIRSSVFAGFILSLSSTAIVLKILLERGEIDTPAGSLMTGILIFQDICVVPLMLFIPVLSGESMSFIAFGVSFFKAIAIAAILFIAAKWLVPNLLHQVVHTKSKELFNITLMLICLGIALITSKFGLSLALGAFLAGLVISESEYAYEAIAEMVPLKDIFMGLFFVSVGMLLDIERLYANWPIILTAAVAVFSIKIISTAIPVAFFSPVRISLLAGIGLAQIGEFSFVLAASGKQMGIISADLYQIFLSTTVVTMVATPSLLKSAPAISSWLISRKPIRWLSRRRKDELHSSRYSDHVVIIGFGLNGKNLSNTLREADLPYIILDLNSGTVRREKKKGQHIYYGDGTSSEILHKLGIHKARVLVIAISDPNSTRKIVSVARLLNPDIHIVVRTKYLSEVEDLMAIGADEVIPEEFETSIEIFSRVLGYYNVPKNVIDDHIDNIRENGYKALRTRARPSRIEKSVHPMMSEIETEAFFVKPDSVFPGKTIHDINLLLKGGVSIVALQRDGKVNRNPSLHSTLKGNDLILLIGEREDLNRAMQQLESEAPAASGRHG